MRRPNTVAAVAATAVALCAALVPAAPAQDPPRPAEAGSTELLVCAPGYPGTAKQAQAVMDELAKQLTARAGWQPGRLTARYVATEKEGLEALKKRPAWILTTTEFYCKHHQAIDGTVIAATQLTHPADAQLKSGVSERFTVLVPEGAKAKDPAAALKGRKLWGTRLLDAAFLSRVAFRGELMLHELCDVQRQKRTLRAVKKATASPDDSALLLSGEEGRLLEEPALAPRLKGWAQLVQSHPVPSAPVLALRNPKESAPATGRLEQFQKALYALNSTEEGKALCTKMRMLGFVKPDAGAYAAAAKRYHAKKQDDVAKDD
ncbi:MAG: hypothetical protein ACYTGX_14765 [Planctomycetota bacterium]|jgi:hypothetical protein